MAKAKPAGKLACGDCGSTATQLGMRDTDGKFVCVPCTPDSTWRMYPGSKKRAMVRERRVKQARKNFGR